MVSSSKTSTDVSIGGSDIEEQIRSKFSSVVQTASQAEVTGSKMETWYNGNTCTAYAFVYVSRTDLAAFYRKQIDLDLGKVETAMGIAGQLVNAGKKMSAFRKCDEAAKLFAGIALYQDLLAAVNAEASDDELQTVRAKELQQTVAQALIELEQSTLVYVDCRYESKGDRDDAFDSDPGIICDIVKQALSENECSVVDDDTEADYTLTLTASTSQRSNGSDAYGIISYYANVKGSLYNRMTKKKTVDFSILNDPKAYAAGRTPEIAASKAFKLPTLKEKILEKILPKIKN
jgi:hypothetical protein